MSGAIFLRVSKTADESVIPSFEVPYTPCLEKSCEQDVESDDDDNNDDARFINESPVNDKLASQISEIQAGLSSLKGAFAHVSEQVNSQNAMINAFEKTLQQSQDHVKEACGEHASHIQELKTGQNEHLSIISTHVSETDMSYRNLYLQLHRALLWHGENLKATIENVIRDRAPLSCNPRRPGVFGELMLIVM